MIAEKIHKIYFLGIGGIGMSAIARYFHARGAMVAGYDRTSTALTSALEEMGMEIHFTDSPELIPNDIDMAVYTPAIPPGLSELNALKQKGLPLLKRSEVLGFITDSAKLLAVAGTHGKTSVSTLCAHILHQSSSGCSAFLGGISKNYDTNYLEGTKGAPIVAEADEYARSFLQLKPQHALITSVDADHLDVYGTHQKLKESFTQFASQIRKGGSLTVKKELLTMFSGVEDVKIFTYSLNETADYYTENLCFDHYSSSFDLVTPQGGIHGLKLLQPGLMHAENAVAASALALNFGVNQSELQSGLKSYKGVKRRFDFRIISNKLIYIDDYAHHPREIEFCINSARMLYPDMKITGVFQPHLFSRTRDFAKGFAESLSKLHRIILLDIYPAREKPIEGISSEWLLNQIEHNNKKLLSADELLSEIISSPPELLITMGAGDIDRLVEPLEKALRDEMNL